MWFVGHCSNEGRLFVVTIVKNYLWNQSRSVGMWRAQFLDPKSFKREKSFDQRWRSNFVDETSQKLRRSGQQKLKKKFFDKNFATTKNNKTGSGSNVTTPKTRNFPGKLVNLRFSDNFSSDRNFFVSKSREISRFRRLNIPPWSVNCTKWLKLNFWN